MWGEKGDNAGCFDAPYNSSGDSFPGVERAAKSYPYWIKTSPIPTETNLTPTGSRQPSYLQRQSMLMMFDGDVDGSSHFKKRLNPK